MNSFKPIFGELDTGADFSNLRMIIFINFIYFILQKYFLLFLLFYIAQIKGGFINLEWEVQFIFHIVKYKLKRYKSRSDLYLFAKD